MQENKSVCPSGSLEYHVRGSKECSLLRSQQSGQDNCAVIQAHDKVILGHLFHIACFSHETPNTSPLSEQLQAREDHFFTDWGLFLVFVHQMAAIVEGKYLRCLKGASDDKIYIPFSPELLSLFSLLREHEELRGSRGLEFLHSKV